MANHKYIKNIFIILTIGFALFIYHNSMFAIQQSDIQSGVVLNSLNKLLAGYDITFTQYSVRKLAHFIEYFIFAIFLTVTLRICSQKINKYLFFELFVFFAVPVLDESIQMFYKGRSSSVLDILIDFAGCLVGMGLCRLLICVFNFIRRKESKN